MFCSTCGAENEDTARTCESCDAPLVRPQPRPETGEAPPAAAGGMDPAQERTWGMLCHLLAFAGFVVPAGGIVGPLVMWMIKKDESAYVDYHGKESVNFQLSLLIYYVVSAILIVVIVGAFLLIALVVFEIVVVIQACLAANAGQYYRYPLCIRFIK